MAALNQGVGGFWLSVMAAGALAGTATAQAPSINAPPAFGVGDRAVILTVRGIGAQIYECKSGQNGRLWVFREPVAALVKDGVTVGRHYAGPTWELPENATLTGKTAASAPGATRDDVPLLKLDVVQHKGEGPLKDATLVLRLNTHGGGLKGPCDQAGALKAVAYSADYVFLK